MKDRPLFRQLKAGFGDSVDYSYEIAEPTVWLAVFYGAILRGGQPGH